MLLRHQLSPFGHELVLLHGAITISIHVLEEGRDLRQSDRAAAVTVQLGEHLIGTIGGHAVLAYEFIGELSLVDGAAAILVELLEDVDEFSLLDGSVAVGVDLGEDFLDELNVGHGEGWEKSERRAGEL